MTDVAPTPSRFSDYLELTKPRLSLLSVLTAAAGYAAVRPFHGWHDFAFMMVGTSLAAGGVAALNQWHERDTDAQMKRTADRPLPSGRIPNGSAFVMGWLLCIGAMMLMYAAVNRLTLLFTFLTIAAYLGWYTPFKRFSRWSTEIGAIAGAFPPLIGWAGAQDDVTPLGWILFAILFFWQIPHFMAVAWTYRKDYSSVHFPMLPVRDESGGRVAAWSLVNAVLLVAATLLPCFLGYDSIGYGVVAGLAGVWFISRAVAFLRPEGRDAAARKLFLASITYLPIVLGALVIDRVFFF